MFDLTELSRLSVTGAYAGSDWRLAAILRARSGEQQVIAARLDETSVFDGLAAWNNGEMSRIDLSLLEGAAPSFVATIFPLSDVVRYAERYVERLLAHSTADDMMAVAEAEIELLSPEVPHPEKFGLNNVVAESVTRLFFLTQLLGGLELVSELRTWQATVVAAWEMRGIAVRALSVLDEAIELCEQLDPVVTPEYLKAQEAAVRILIMLHLWPIDTEDLRG